MRLSACSLSLSSVVALLVACGGQVGPSAIGAPGTGDGGTAPVPVSVTSAFPTGLISNCVGETSIGSTGLSSQATVTLTEAGGIVTASLQGGDGAPIGDLKFAVTTATTATALPGQTVGLLTAAQLQAFDQDPGDLPDAGTSAPVLAGALTLVDGNLALTAAAAGGLIASVACVLPYPPCPSSAPDPAAAFATGEHFDCGGGSLAIARSGGTVTVTLAPSLTANTALPSSLTLDVIAPGVASLVGADGGAPAPCGANGEDAVIVEQGGYLFLSAGTDWQVTGFACTSSNDPSLGDAGPRPSTVETPPDDAGTVQRGRTVTECSACAATELCTAVTFQGDECFALQGEGSGSGSGAVEAGTPACMTGTTYDEGANCCVVDPIVTNSCWPIPPSCDRGINCECVSGIVYLACGYGAYGGCADGGDVSVSGAVVSCLQDSP